MALSKTILRAELRRILSVFGIHNIEVNETTTDWYIQNEIDFVIAHYGLTLATKDITTVAGQHEYTLDLTRLLAYDCTYDGMAVRTYNQISEMKLKDYDETLGDTIAVGVPNEWGVSETKLYVRPAPVESSKTITVYGIAYPSEATVLANALLSKIIIWKCIRNMVSTTSAVNRPEGATPGILQTCEVNIREAERAFEKRKRLGYNPSGKTEHTPFNEILDREI